MRVLYVATLSITINSFLIPHIRMLLKEGNQVDIACNVDQLIKQELTDNGVRVHDIPFSRLPLSEENINAYKQLKKLIIQNHYDIVHCHTPNAAAMTRLACRKLRKKGLKVFYTAHGFHFYKGAPLKNWLLYYPVEWLCAHWTDILITINKEDYTLAKRRMKARKTEYVPGVGIDLTKFQADALDRTDLRSALCIRADDILLLSVGELNANKNHEAVIRAIAKLNNQKIHYAIAGQGELTEYLEKISIGLGINDQIHILGFRKDIIALYHAADMFVFPSYREGLSVALMEAMACGLPVICSIVRGNTDLIDERGGEFFHPTSVDSCQAAIENLIKFSAFDRSSMGRYNAEKIKMFDVATVVEQMNCIYSSRIEI